MGTSDDKYHWQKCREMSRADTYHHQTALAPPTSRAMFRVHVRSVFLEASDAMNLAWHIGEVTITRILETNLELASGTPGSIIPDATREEIARIPWLGREFVTDDGLLKFSVQALLLESPHGRFVVDPCIGNFKPRAVPIYNMLDTSFLERFEGAGWPTSSVDMVICTHLHMDHVGRKHASCGRRLDPDVSERAICLRPPRFRILFDGSRS